MPRPCLQKIILASAEEAIWGKRQWRWWLRAREEATQSSPFSRES